MVEINAKGSYSVAKTASYNKTTTLTVTAPAHTTIHYRDGIITRTFRVTRTHTYSNCQQSKKYGTVWAVDNYSTAS